MIKKTTLVLASILMFSPVSRSDTLNTLSGFYFDSIYLMFDKYEENNSELTLFVEYSKKDDNKHNSSNNKAEISPRIELEVVLGICQNDFIKSIINAKNKDVYIEYTLWTGEKYMVRKVESCKRQSN